MASGSDLKAVSPAGVSGGLPPIDRQAPTRGPVALGQRGLRIGDFQDRFVRAEGLPNEFQVPPIRTSPNEELRFRTAFDEIRRAREAA